MNKRMFFFFVASLFVGNVAGMEPTGWLCDDVVGVVCEYLPSLKDVGKFMLASKQFNEQHVYENHRLKFWLQATWF